MQKETGYPRRYSLYQNWCPIMLAETGFEPALPTSKSGRPLSLSAFCPRNSRFLACITFLLLPPAAVGAAAPGTRRSQGIKKDTRFSLVSQTVDKVILRQRKGLGNKSVSQMESAVGIHFRRGKQRVSRLFSRWNSSVYSSVQTSRNPDFDLFFTK